MKDKKFLRSLFVALILMVSLGATCPEIHTRTGTWYKVKSGDSLSKISYQYKVSIQTIADFNNIKESSQLKAGDRVFIPNPNMRQSTWPFKGVIRPYTPPPVVVTKPPATTPDLQPTSPEAPTSGDPTQQQEETEAVAVTSGKFLWPVSGKVTSPFGMRNGRRHDGIDIVAPRGTPIKASAAGEVAYSGVLRGYGNIVLVKHADNFFTAYAHNARNLVKKGDQVKQGDIVGRVGSTGNATAALVHFEVRKGSQARNPLFFLPKK